MTWWALSILWMVWIFSASTELGSHEQSSRYIGPLLQWMLPSASEETLHWIHLGIRKLGHLVQYAILATLLWRACGHRWGIALLISVAYAATDEWHQSLVPSRMGSVQDVMIDTVGAALGLLFFETMARYRRRHRVES